jgi:hypothetical protein
MPSIAMKHLLPMGLALASGLSLCQCANSDPKRVADKAAPRVEWYLASKDPPTYCPVGHALPQRGSAEEARAQYITLADRPTRYYIPPGCDAHRKLALRLQHHTDHPGLVAGEMVIVLFAGVSNVLVYGAAIPLLPLKMLADMENERRTETPHSTPAAAAH